MFFPFPPPIYWQCAYALTAGAYLAAVTHTLAASARPARYVGL